MIATLSRLAAHLSAALFFIALVFVATPDASAQPSTANTAGSWDATFQWDGADPGHGIFLLSSDGTFRMQDFEYTGRWRVRGNTFWLRIDQAPNSVYSGAFRSDGSISGTIQNSNNMRGTFTFVRSGASTAPSTSPSGYLPENFDVESARRALAGDHQALLGAFVFQGTPQGHAYWYSLYESTGPLPAEAQAQLREWIARAEGQGGGGSYSGSGKPGAVRGGGEWRALVGDWQLTANLRGNTCSAYYRFIDSGSALTWYSGNDASSLGLQTSNDNFRDLGGGVVFYSDYDDQHFQIIGGELVRTDSSGARFCTFRRVR